MAIDHRIGNKVQKSLRTESAPATRVDPYPYIGIVKNNLDPTRTGRLQVWIPDMGGNPGDPKNWRTVSYASPFMGTTSIANSAGKLPNVDNRFTNTPHTYGMWMVPPDNGVEVLVIFAAGDPLRGYWIACVNSSISRHMIPAVAAAGNLALAGASADVRSTLTSNSIAPVTEFNDNDPALAQKPSFYTNAKPVHEPQYRVLKEQGLDRDTARGIISSSSQRESPSTVFGISTPGRPFEDPLFDSTFAKKVADGTLTEADYTYKTRKGGHSFVMDDGNLLGGNQLLRLRTASGHQIMMNDSSNTLYINHADGSSWVELTASGAVNVYSKAGVNIRTEGTMNLHADADININAGGSLNLKAGSRLQLNSATTNMLQGRLTVETTGQAEFKAGAGFSVDSSSVISLKAGGVLALEGSSIKQNSGGTLTVKGVTPIRTNNLPDVGRADSSSLWVAQPGLLQSIVTVAPTHEPYPRGQVAEPATNTATTPPPDPPPAASPGIAPGKYTGSYDATKNTAGVPYKNKATDEDLRKQPEADCTIGKFTKDQLTAYFATIGKSESGGNYAAVNSIGYVGKYQFGALALIDGGYVKSSSRQNDQLRNPNSWTGKNGIDSLEKWLEAKSLQEEAMCEYTKRNYLTGCKIGAISQDMPPEEIAGILAVAHLLGAGGANKWRKGEGGADAFGTTGESYFQKGKYAVAVLAPQVATLDTPPTTA
jgi:hypothetical protein